MKKNKSWALKVIFGLAICISVFIGIKIAVSFFSDMREYSLRMEERNDYKNFTSPLPQKTIDDICTKFTLPKTDPRCLYGSIVYGPEFFPEIIDSINFSVKEETSREVIDGKLGPYLIDCDEIIDDKGSYCCTYDITGDGWYPISIFFSKDGFAFRVIANTGGS